MNEKTSTFYCDGCRKLKTVVHSDITTGYGIDKNGNKFCYSCCADNDRKIMRETGKYTLYLVGNNNQWEITNWPGSLSFPARVVKGRHNIARVRYDAWFNFDGHIWHGVTYGDHTQVCHCKRTKETYTMPENNTEKQTTLPDIRFDHFVVSDPTAQLTSPDNNPKE